jgi:glycosyltransferase involved in cell wall biosynthesis
MNKTTRQAILVLGMHRSGTSALAGALGLLGARVPAQQLPPHPDNPKGYFESEQIRTVHDRLLMAAGTSWFNLERIADEWFQSTQAATFVDEIVDAIGQDFGDAALFVVKDPRMCRLMPVWRKVLDRIGAQPRIAITLRNPLEVAGSLNRRDGLPIAYGCLLWLGHVIEAERVTRGERRVFKSYDDLLLNPVRTAEYVAAQLGIDGLPVNKDSARAIADFVDPALRHNVAGVEELDLSIAFYPWLLEAYQALADLARDPNDEAAQKRLDDIRAFFDPAVASLAPLFVTGEQVFAELQLNAVALKHALAERPDRVDAFNRTLETQWATAAKLQEAIAKREEKIVHLSDALDAQHVRIAAFEQALAQRDAELDVLRQTVSSLQGSISEIRASTSWRISWPLRAVRRLLDHAWAFVRILPLTIVRGGGVVGAASKARAILRDEGLPGLKRALAGFYGEAAGGDVYAGRRESGGSYQKWVEKYDTLNDGIRAKIRDHIGRLRHKPLISVVMPVYNPNPIHLDETIRSVRMQLYPHWELCIADDASTDRKVRQVIDRNAKLDSRIKVVYRKTNGHISQATNSALEFAHGEFVAFLDHDDVLSEHALYWVAAELEAHPQTDILYSDSDFLDDDDVRSRPYFKPDFNLELMLGHNLVNHLGVYRRSLVEAVGGMRVGFEGSQDYDLLFSVLGKSAVERVRHIPVVLYHWRRSDKAPPYSSRNLDRCAAAARAAVTDFLASRGVEADVLPAPKAINWQRIRYHLPDPAPKVSVIIPTKNQFELLQKCVRGVLNDTDYPSLEVVIVDHESDDVQTKALLKELAKDPRVRVLPYVGPFNFSAINNFAVRNSKGEILAFLNNDLEILHSDWLREMVSHVMRPKIGAVGAKLYYPNGKIQHAGVIIGMGGVAGHQFLNMPHDFPGPNGETILVHELSAVTGACMVVRRSTFVEVGGFDAINLPVAFNDIDFCLRLREHGYRNIFTPFAEFIHHESASRGLDLAPEKQERFRKECEYMSTRWGEMLERDPYYNPNLSLQILTAGPAAPPRVSYPWETRA